MDVKNNEYKYLPAITTKLPSSSALANGRYKITLRYDGMKSSDPTLNMERWEKRPLGGLK